MEVKRSGSQPSGKGPPEWFTGAVRIDSPFQRGEPARVGGCTDYAHRQRRVKDCVRLNPRNVKRLTWLPPTCAYRIVAAGGDLPWWHPLVSGSQETVHAAGISVRGRVSASEQDVPDERLEDFIVAWPGKWPRGAKRKRAG